MSRAPEPRAGSVEASSSLRDPRAFGRDEARREDNDSEPEPTMVEGGRSFGLYRDRHGSLLWPLRSPQPTTGCHRFQSLVKYVYKVSRHMPVLLLPSLPAQAKCGVWSK